MHFTTLGGVSPILVFLLPESWSDCPTYAILDGRWAIFTFETIPEKTLTEWKSETSICLVRLFNRDCLEFSVAKDFEIRHGCEF
jgi:hypothetical protein